MVLQRKPTLNYGFTAKTGWKRNYLLLFISQQEHSNINIYNQLQQTAILAHRFFNKLHS